MNSLSRISSVFEFLVISMQLLDRLPKGNAHLRDQLKRASTSIPLNLAEGSGKMTNPDKLRFYAIARGSAMECAAICDVISHFEPQLSSQADRGKKLLEEVTRILTSICFTEAEAETKDKAKAKI